MRTKQVFKMKKTCAVPESHTVSNEISSDNQMGAPVRIISLEDGKLKLDEEALSQILLNDFIRNKPVVVISIAGDFRKGKSFLLNLFLRYLQSGRQNDWLDDVEAPLKGFSWKGGSDRDTSGILMWSQPFIIKGNDGRDVAVLLMDTQGSFGTDDTIQDSAKVFAMSTLTSSVQIYNLMHNLQEDNLQVLDLFTEYGQLVFDISEENRVPFQKLMFLIRDSPFAEFDFGLEGGNSLLEKRLAIDPSKPPELKRLRHRIRSSFEVMNCYLLPYPGNKVARSGDNFNGKVADIDIEFIQHVRQLVSLMFDSSYFVVKQIGGQPVTGNGLFNLIKVYIEAFADKSMPKPMTIYEAMAKVSNLNAVESTLNYYKDSMKSFCGSEKKYLKPKLIQLKHIELKAEAIEKFDEIRKMGDQDLIETHKEQLIQNIDDEHQRLQAQNKNNYSYLPEKISAGVITTGAIALIAILLR